MMRFRDTGPVWPQEADEWLQPNEAVERQSDPLVRVVEGVLEVSYRKGCPGSSQNDSGDLRGPEQRVICIWIPNCSARKRNGAVARNGTSCYRPVKRHGSRREP
jgi:hypothetical protein